jgi:hypothetical protein
MQWLSELIKQINISKSFTTGICIASGILIFGPRIFPSFITPIPTQWHWFVLCAFILCLVLTLVWLLPFLGKAAIELFNRVVFNSYFIKKDSWEYTILLWLGSFADRPMNLEEVSKRVTISKLELLEISRKLKQRGLITSNKFDENLLTLTARGRKYVLKHQTKSVKA